MAGMLPGVEVARRRRFHQSALDSPCSSGSGPRRTSFCLYPTNHDSHLNSNSNSPTVHRCPEKQALDDHKLGDVAREAKKRLDTRLRLHQWKPEPDRDLSSIQFPRKAEQRETGAEIRTLKRSGSKRFNWPKLGWKSSEQKECAVCLEQFRTGEKLMNLPCAHRFHSKCLLPWLDNNSHCPCCRFELV